MEPWFETFYACAEIAGTVAFAAAGAMIAIDRGLDMFGVLLLGVLAATGGGILRDVLLGLLPPGAFRVPTYVAVAAATALVVFLFAWLEQGPYRAHYRQLDRIITLLDAVGLGIFGVIGVELSLGQGHDGNVFLCVFMGMTTAVGGGVIRDVLSSTVPVILKERIYAVASILGCAVYYGLRHTALSMPAATAAGMLVTVAVRLFTARFHWNLPKVPPRRD